VPPKKTLDRLSLDAIVAEFNKSAGEEVIITGSRLLDRKVVRVTTGLPALDVALGGGWAVNQWHEIVGLESSGKTVLAAKTVAANQALNPEFEVLWVAAEGFEAEWYSRIGVDMSRVRVIESNALEQVLALIVRVVRERACDMIVLDSLPAMLPDGEAVKEMGESTVGLVARLMAMFSRKIQSAGKRSLTEPDRPCTGLLINQWRDQIGVMWGDPRTTPGGKAKNYLFYTRTEVKRDEWIEDGPKSAKFKVGQTIKIRTFKNKSAPAQRVAEADFYFADSPPFRAGQFDEAKQVIGLAMTSGVVKRAGAWYTFGGQQWQGGDAVVHALREDVDLMRQVTAEVNRRLLSGEVDEPEETEEEPKKRKVVRR
jgi:recombination protein RecA